jgi:hypothetical protein
MAGAACAQTAVWTQHNDNQRTGANLKETVLNTQNVNARQFGKLFARPVTGQIYAQPLYVPNMTIPGKGRHNVVFVASEHNDVYAFDADDPKETAPLWHDNLGPGAPTPNDDFGNSPDYGVYHDLFPEIGITSTPVIDFARHTIYVCVFNKLGPKQYLFKLHALDLQTGMERPGSPVTITASCPGTGIDNVKGVITFNPMQQLQRPGLLLDGGVIYLAFGSHADCDPYHGWVMGYDSGTLRQVSVFCTTPDGTEGAIWQAGQGPAADKQGNIYVMTGNGTASAPQGGTGYSQAFLKLKPTAHGLTVADWFIPYNADALSAQDQDIGDSGSLLIPDFPLVVGGSKNGEVYAVNRSDFGHWHQSNNDEILENFQAGAGHIHGSPIYWNGAVSGPLVYLWSEHDYLKAFKVVNGQLQTTPAFQGMDLPGPNMPGGFLSISANGNKAGTGILWATTPVDDDANLRAVTGVLRAYDAANVTHELWNSLQNPKRDEFGLFAKFCPPTVVNGKVYLATFSNQLVVYGLLPTPKSAGTQK